MYIHKFILRYLRSIFTENRILFLLIDLFSSVGLILNHNCVYCTRWGSPPVSAFHASRIMVSDERKRATCLPRMMQPPNVMRCNTARESTYSVVHTGAQWMKCIWRTRYSLFFFFLIMASISQYRFDTISEINEKMCKSNKGFKLIRIFVRNNYKRRLTSSKIKKILKTLSIY